jgi:predicted RecB family nuclease
VTQETAVRPPESKRGRRWISKSDVVRYLHCPDSWWLRDRGAILFDDEKDELRLSLAAGGVEFEDLASALPGPSVLRPTEWGCLIDSETRVFSVPPLENSALGIFGSPDGVDCANGHLRPIVVTSRQIVGRSDELELAFDWLLLQPLRRREAEPCGVVIMRRDGRFQEVDIPIAEHRMEEVRRLVKEIRIAKRDGVWLRVCGCPLCRALRRDELQELAGADEELSVVFGLGPSYSEALIELGVRTWRDLDMLDPEELRDRMADGRHLCISVAEVGRWQRHADSYASGQPVVFGTDVPPPEDFVALDLEWTEAGHVFLIGLVIQRAGQRVHRALWSDTPEQLAHNLAELSTLLNAERELPVLTWAGGCADLPALRKAEERCGVAGAADRVASRHLDLYVHVRRNLRIPIPQLDLKAVSSYFGIPRYSRIADGMEAQLRYLEYQKHGYKRSLREELIDYNRDDVDGLADVADNVRLLCADPSLRALPVAPERPRPGPRPVVAAAPSIVGPLYFGTKFVRLCRGCGITFYTDNVRQYRCIPGCRGRGRGAERSGQAGHGPDQGGIAVG